MDKRERVLKTLQLEQPDIVPIHSLGYEAAAGGYRDFLACQEYAEFQQELPGVGDITEIRWWNADIWQMDPWQEFTDEFYPAPRNIPALYYILREEFIIPNRLQNPMTYTKPI